MIKKFCKPKMITIRELSRFIDSFIACCPAIEYSWMYTKNFEREKVLGLKKHHDNYEVVIKLNLNPTDLK